jgi:DNA-binding transcriptional ArsR family regulator
MLRALADGTRRQILALVWRDERTAGEIAAEFTMTRSAVSSTLPFSATAS